MITYIAMTMLSFGNVFFRAFQQKNVIHRRVALILPASLIMAIGELLTPALFVTNYIGGDLQHIIIMILCVGFGGGTGCITSLYAHDWLTKKLYKWHEGE